jgi:hypothetical protein
MTLVNRLASQSDSSRRRGGGAGLRVVAFDHVAQELGVGLLDRIQVDHLPVDPAPG